MKLFLKITLLVMLFALIASCNQSSTKLGKINDYIPENSSLIFSITDYESLKSDIKNSGFISEFDKTSLYSYFTKNVFFKNINPSNESILCFSQNKNDYTFISVLAPALFNKDSIKNSSTREITYNKQKIFHVSIDSTNLYTTQKDSVFIASSSQQIIKDILDEKVEKDLALQKVYTIKNDYNLKAITKFNEVRINDSISVNFASWASFNTEILPDVITATGVLLANDSVPQLLNVFKGLNPQQNKIANITPVDANNVTAITFNDFETFHNNLNSFNKNNSDFNELSPLLEAVSEVGYITHALGNSVALNSIDPSITKDELIKYSTLKNSFKEVQISELNRPSLIEDVFHPLFKKTNFHFSFQIEDFFVLCENEAIAQHIITSYLNNNCLSKTSYYKETAPQLSSASSLLFMKLNGDFSNNLSSFFSSGVSSEIKNISLKKYPLAILQLSYDRDFAHLNLVCKEVSSSKKTSGIVSQLSSISFENQLLGNPQFFNNHRSKGKDIIVQDINNTLHFISAKGKTLWTKKLKSPLLGKVNEIDILKNGKKQLAFTTKHNFYVLDRNGKNVAPFPLKFKDDITQALSVFDYDNKRNYRFIITQGNEIFMYDSMGKNVKGFTFKKTSSPIVLPPQHIRMGNKDYILIAEENGKLNIVSRVGKQRVKVAKTFNFSEMSIAKEANNFVVITKENTKESISQAGKVTSKKLNVSSNYWFTVKGKTKVTLDDYLLRINGKLIELPLGIYYQPEIFTVNRKTYITITETQEKKVYVYSKSGDLLSGFPVFGASKAILGDANNNGKLNILVPSDAKTITLYEN